MHELSPRASTIPVVHDLQSRHGSISKYRHRFESNPQQLANSLAGCSVQLGRLSHRCSKKGFSNL
jgi:hypothetical protein